MIRDLGVNLQVLYTNAQLELATVLSTDKLGNDKLQICLFHHIGTKALKESIKSLL